MLFQIYDPHFLVDKWFVKCPPIWVLKFVCMFLFFFSFMMQLGSGGSRNSERGGGANSLINNYFFSVNITIYRNKV